jgi:aquaporin Z
MSDNVKYVVEVLGTFFFLSVILNTLTDSSVGPIGVAVALLAAIYFGASISGAHFNPAVSVAMYLKNKMTLNLLIGYVIAQLVGGSLAVAFSNYKLSA